MPIFKCEKCGMVENTSLCHYWYRVGAEKKEALCSQCDPEIAKWHGQFSRTTPESHGYVKGPDNFWYMPDDDYLKRLIARDAKKSGDTKKS